MVIDTDTSLRLYVHIPFCTKKCPYCHFYSVVDDESLKDRFLLALCSEIEQSKGRLLGREIVSIYFGGGTPFLFGPSRISVVLNKLSSLTLGASCEITIEANPETTHIKDLQEYASIGINRLSIGAQSFSSDHLQTLQRGHTAECTLRVIDQSIASGLPNISIDLMYDLPGLTLEAWKQTVEAACRLPIRHLSLYNLTIEPKTAWFRKKAAIEALMPNQETSLQMITAAQEIAERHRFYQYEISAFAHEGFSSRHNTGYWEGRDFLGFGPSAFSFFNGTRFSNIPNIHTYINAQEMKGSAIDTVDDLSSEKRLREMVAIGLRMNKGICLSDLEDRWGPADEELIHTLKYLESLNLLQRKGPAFCLTGQGRRVYDAIAVEII